MRSALRLAGAVSLSAVATAGIVLALEEDDPGRWRLYKLRRDSTYQRGCFPPCMCPMLETAPLRGTFLLRLVGIGDLFDFYEVRDVRFWVRRSYDKLVLDGTGLYRLSELARLHHLRLDLTGGTNAETYDSGEVVIEHPFPRIDIAVSLNGGYCFDTVLELRARPAGRLRVDSLALDWDPDPDAAEGYEVVVGDLGRLRSGNAGFADATTACLADRYASEVLPFADQPPPGAGWWFLMRAEGDVYGDGDPADPTSPDAGIAASQAACP